MTTENSTGAATPATTEQGLEDDGVEFIEGGPFPDTPVEIDELSPEDVAYIRETIAQ